MNFLEEIQKKRNNLKTSETTITFSDGRKFIETKLGELKEINEKSCGFVIDTKPDLIPAEICTVSGCKLYLGSQDAVNSNNIENYNLTHILSIGIPTPDFSSTSMPTSEFIECLDLPETILLPILLKANSFIRNAFQIEGHNLLIHCNAGVSRSSAIAIGYLILENKFKFKDAFDLVKEKRNCIQPNVGFVRQLKELDLIEYL